MSENANPTLTLKLSGEELNVILSVLQEVSYKVAKPLLDTIIPQITPSDVSNNDTETN